MMDPIMKPCLFCKKIDCGSEFKVEYSTGNSSFENELTLTVDFIVGDLLNIKTQEWKEKLGFDVSQPLTIPICDSCKNKAQQCLIWHHQQVKATTMLEKCRADFKNEIIISRLFSNDMDGLEERAVLKSVEEEIIEELRRSNAAPPTITMVNTSDNHFNTNSQRDENKAEASKTNYFSTNESQSSLLDNNSVSLDLMEPLSPSPPVESSFTSMVSGESLSLPVQSSLSPVNPLLSNLTEARNSTLMWKRRSNSCGSQSSQNSASSESKREAEFGHDDDGIEILPTPAKPTPIIVTIDSDSDSEIEIDEAASPNAPLPQRTRTGGNWRQIKKRKLKSRELAKFSPWVQDCARNLLVYKCPLCCAFYDRDEWFKCHMRRHRKKLPSKCNMCDWHMDFNLIPKHREYAHDLDNQTGIIQKRNPSSSKSFKFLTEFEKFLGAF